MEVVGDRDEIEAGLLGAVGVGDEVVRVMLLAHQAVAERRHRVGH
jgi:hypothetical protein